MKRIKQLLILLIMILGFFSINGIDSAKANNIHQENFSKIAQCSKKAEIKKRIAEKKIKQKKKENFLSKKASITSLFICAIASLAGGGGILALTIYQTLKYSY